MCTVGWIDWGPEMRAAAARVDAGGGQATRQPPLGKSFVQQARGGIGMMSGMSSLPLQAGDPLHV